MAETSLARSPGGEIAMTAAEQTLADHGIHNAAEVVDSASLGNEPGPLK
jgi:hypothetical protein